ncbi:host attachment protein [uncultured Paracoccus sp.]|uniref:baeRF12 domain-containing protein n=1 Tax=uncultured Paracoccus sp. TaxID=189685 RepID=UPI0025D58790|nr:host attachment protein [uncultured Paracoccus sp.]
MLPHNALVVVADGHSATLFRNTAKHGLGLTQTERVTLASLNKPDAASADGVPGDDPDLFAMQLADHLNGMILRNKVDDIAVIADPSTLGTLRKRYHKELQFRLRKEVTKNLSNSDLRAIEDALS